MIEVIQTPCHRCDNPAPFINCHDVCEQGVHGVKLDWYNQDGDSLGSACPDTDYEGALPLCNSCFNKLMVWLQEERSE